MWDFLSEVLKEGGLLAVVEAVQLIVIYYLFRTLRQKDTELTAMAEKRIDDLTDAKDDFQELSKNLDRSIDLLIKVIKKD